MSFILNLKWRRHLKLVDPTKAKMTVYHLIGWWNQHLDRSLSFLNLMMNGFRRSFLFGITPPIHILGIALWRLCLLLVYLASLCFCSAPDSEVTDKKKGGTQEDWGKDRHLFNFWVESELPMWHNHHGKTMPVINECAGSSMYCSCKSNSISLLRTIKEDNESKS